MGKMHLPGCTPSLRCSTKKSHMPVSGLRTPHPSLPVAYMIVAGTFICIAVAAISPSGNASEFLMQLYATGIDVHLAVRCEDCMASVMQI